MNRFGKKWKSFSFFARAFLILALVFFVVGMGTLGSAQSTGRSYELKKGSSVVFRLEKQEGQTSLKYLYLNIGTIYNEIGSQATIRVRRASSPSTGSWYVSNFGEAKLDNLYSDQEKSAKGISFNWFTPYDLSKVNYSLSTYAYYELTAMDCSLLVNEVVFVADDGTLVPAKIERGYSSGIDAAAAASVLDAQKVPSLAQSSFFRYGEDEAYSMMTVAEMRAGSAYSEGSVYHMDRVYNLFGLDILALGTLIFGMSPFGRRFCPFLAAFGCLIVGYLLTKRLFRSDKAGFAFALLFALGGYSFCFGHLGTPLFIGVFFLLASVYAAYSFYANGMKNADLKSARSLFAAGILAAAAICVNTVFVVPALATVALFAAGMVRQQKAKAFYLSKAEAEPALGAEGAQTKEETVSAVRAEYRYKNRIAPAAFVGMLLVGTFAILLLSVLPAYFTLVKVFDNPAAPALSLFALLWKGIAGGFTGVNAVASAQSVWSLTYTLFRGTGDFYAVTLATANVVSIVIAVFGLIFTLIRTILLARCKEKSREIRIALRGGAVSLIAFALSFICAFFSAQAFIAFVAAQIFSFIAVSGLLADQGKSYRSVRALIISLIVLLALYFVVTVPFLFSIPFPAAWFAAM